MFVVWSKYYVRDRLGLRTDSELAKLFGVSRSAVSQWPRNKAIPPLRRYMLQQQYPMLFPSDRGDAASPGVPQTVASDAMRNGSDDDAG